jgi:glycosyltransferase involved in cell wall biosynthesis
MPSPHFPAPDRVALPSRPRRPASATVVIPCYRYGRYLPGAVSAAFAQRHVDMRVIIVDDASPDDSLRVARRLAERDERIRVVAHRVNRGHIRTYNDGLAGVDTDFVALVSADDLLAPGAIDRAVGLMQAQPAVGLAFGKIVRFGDAAPPRRISAGYWRTWGGRLWAEGVAGSGWNPIMSPGR